MSISRSAAYTTSAPSAAVGNFASRPRAVSMTTSTSASATSEYIWVRPPTRQPSAVRLALELTGKPWVRPAPTLQTPSARSSALASTDSPLTGREGPRGQHGVGEGHDRHAAGHGGQRRRRRATGWPTARRQAARPGPRRRPGCRSGPSENTATATVASSTAMNGPGQRGTPPGQHEQDDEHRRREDEGGHVHLVAVEPASERICSTIPSPSTGTPVSLPSWLPIMMTATPVM